MSQWFECKVKYEKVDAMGKEKKVTEPYLVDAVSFTDAEKRIHEKIIQYVSGEFTVTNIKIANFSEIHPNENGDRWFKCKVSFVTLDEEKGIEKKTNSYLLVQANNVHEAYTHLEEGLRGIVSDYEIPSIQESPIVDIFPYFDNDSDEEVPSNYTKVEQEAASDFDSSASDFQSETPMEEASEEEPAAESTGVEIENSEEDEG